MFAIDAQMSLCYDNHVGAAAMLPSFLQKTLDSNVTS